MMMSQRTTSGRTSWTFSIARRPLPTVTTSKSSSEKVSSITFWIVMLSSASKIFLPITSPAPSRGGSWGLSARILSDKDSPLLPLCQRLIGHPASAARGSAGFDHADDVLGRGSGEEHLDHSHRLQLRDVLRGNDPAHEDVHGLHRSLLQQPDHAPADRQVRAGEDREADRVHVLLGGGGHDLLPALAQAGVDHLPAPLP